MSSLVCLTLKEEAAAPFHKNAAGKSGKLRSSPRK
jgi:hypothetical protein